jgi:uncharacterized membrane protein YadS
VRTIAAAASFLSDHYGGPAMLFALLIGIAFNFTRGGGPLRRWGRVRLALRAAAGGGLLGIRITVGEIAALRLADIRRWSRG